MSAKHTISINGRAYDAITGLPVDGIVDDLPEVPVVTAHKAERPEVHREPVHHSASVHQQTHKSSTLRRGHLAIPTSKVPVSAPQKHTAGHVERSGMISHFATHPKPLPKNRSPRMINDIGPVARRAITAPSTQEKISSREVKEQLIAHAGKEVDRKLDTKHHAPEKKKRAPLFKRVRKQHLAVAGIAALLLAGYVTYLNVPGISVRIAAAQAGVNAKYPDYNPDGYSFVGPVKYEQGEVDLAFKSNGGGEGYTITQKNSNWNSSAVRDNLVDKEALGNEVGVYSVGGVIIYTYGTNAAWTNGGVLYQISGKAPLSTDQLRAIASSM